MNGEAGFRAVVERHRGRLGSRFDREGARRGDAARFGGDRPRFAQQGDQLFRRVERLLCPQETRPLGFRRQ